MVPVAAAAERPEERRPGSYTITVTATSTSPPSCHTLPPYPSPCSSRSVRILGHFVGQELERHEAASDVLGVLSTPIPPPPSFSKMR